MNTHNIAAKPLLQTTELSMEFGGLKALNSVDVTVSEGEVVGLIGPNGAGKTTFFNMLTGIYAPSAGAINMSGISLVGLSPTKIANLGVIRTFQTCRLWDDMSILENLLMGTYMRKKPGLFQTLLQYQKVKDDFAEKADEALKVVGEFDTALSSDYDRKVGELSLVDRRRVEISRAILARPRLLLLDEPAAGMDPSETRQLMGDIKKLQSAFVKMGVVLIEHDMTVISGVADKVVILNFGTKIAEGSFVDVKNNPEVIAAYLGGEAHA
ncbi:MAG: ABC transporter ATP-binding protein [Proteobacteria bacterium]|nr:ABC transporter ATP-binding protein [Pseudomonadota bacterium]MBU1057505.1 ABC transporter ATP-binding protein [Pseudomonadota bacterium]